jgi:erythromycin esterase-like protein
MDLVGAARIVLRGETPHGAHEFYHERAQITKRLITEKGFTGAAVEAYWPDAYRVNRYQTERAPLGAGVIRRRPRPLGGQE